VTFLLRSSLSSSEIKVCGCLRRAGIGSSVSVSLYLYLSLLSTRCGGYQSLALVDCNGPTVPGRRARSQSCSWIWVVCPERLFVLLQLFSPPLSAFLAIFFVRVFLLLILVVPNRASYNAWLWWKLICRVCALILMVSLAYGLYFQLK